MKYLLLITLFLSPFFSQAETCNADHLTAQYKIEQLNQSGREIKYTTTLVRHGQQLVHLFEDQKYGDWWHILTNNQLMLTRVFPEAKRSIEYQAEDIQQTKKNNVLWQQKWQLISEKLLTKTQLVTYQGKGCRLVEHRTFEQHGTKYLLRWLPKLSLIERLDIIENNMVKASWQLNNLDTNRENMAEFIKNLQSFQSTDYADIGDMESDPFLAQMINQGFSMQVEAEVNHEHSH